jgi:hypothetical protein
MKNIADQPVKRIWSTPQVIIIATCDIEGGRAPGFHEGSITNTIFLGVGSYLFQKTTGGNTIAGHPENFYFS